MKLCIVSPHLDDALLSCGVRVQRRRALGDEVLVLNVFTAGARAAERRAEDIRATAQLGASAVVLDELDAPDRDAAYHSLRALVFGPLAADDPVVDRVERRVREVLAAHAIDVAYFPLAVGTHIDHRVVHAVGRRISGYAVRFYEDRPYVLWPGALQARMRALGVDAGLPAVTPAAMAAAVDEYAYLEHFLPRAQRGELLPLYLREAAQGPARAARCDALTATADELRALYAALACYASQMPVIYPDEATFLRDSLRHEAARTGEAAYVERTWELPRPG